MTVAEIRENIRYNENLIEQFSKEKKTIEAQISELDALRSKFTKLQVSFGDRQKQRLSKLSSFLNSRIQSRILNKYYSGMNSLLSGSDFNNTYNGLSEAKRIIGQKIITFDQQLDDCEGRIAYRRQRYDYWKQQLVIALSDAAE